MSIEADIDLAGSLSIGLGKIQASVDKLSGKLEREEQLRLSAYPRQLPFFQVLTSASPASGLIDLDGPRMGREWEVRIISAVAMPAANNAFSTFPTSATTTGVQASATFAATAAGSVSLPNGVPITGFTIQMAPASATVAGVATVTNVAGGTMSYEIVDQTGGGESLTVNFPNPLPTTGPGVAATVNVPALATGGAGSIVIYGVTTVAAIPSPIVTFYEGQLVASPAAGILPAGQVRWQFNVVPAFENFSADQFIIHQNTHLIIGATGIPAGTNLYVMGVINDIPKGRSSVVTLGG